MKVTNNKFCALPCIQEYRLCVWIMRVSRFGSNTKAEIFQGWCYSYLSCSCSWLANWESSFYETQHLISSAWYYNYSRINPVSIIHKSKQENVSIRIIYGICLVSCGQTAFFSLSLGKEKKGSGLAVPFFLPTLIFSATRPLPIHLFNLVHSPAPYTMQHGQG